jgi:flagellar basal body-associated protein FliL
VSEETVEQNNKPAREGGSIGKSLMVVVVALLSSAMGGTITWFLTSRTMSRSESTTEVKQEQTQENAVAEALEKGAAVPLEQFVVNLADAEAARYLRIKISLMVDDKTHIKEVQENQALQLKLRDVILQTLTQKTSQELINEEGKNKLREEIQGKLQGYFKSPKLVDVMFTDFVIQL